MEEVSAHELHSHVTMIIACVINMVMCRLYEDSITKAMCGVWMCGDALKVCSL